MSDLLNRKVICRICSEEISMRVITHHLKTHNIQFLEYVKYNRIDFPNWKECPICHINLTRGRTCSRECDKEFRRGQTGEKSVRWGAKLSKKTKNKISKTRKKQGNFWKGKVHSVETKKNMSKYWKGKRTGKDNGMFGKTHTPEAIEKILSHRQ